MSNFYPPRSAGGYEQWCQEVAVELVRRGHRVSVLTSRPAPGASDRQKTNLAVYRSLNLEVEGGIFSTAVRLLHSRRRLEKENLNHVRRLVTELAPDVAMVWGMWNVPRSAPALLEQLLPGRVVYYLCDYWPSLPSAYVQQLQNPAAHPWTRLLKRLVGRFFLTSLKNRKPIPLQLEHPICVSRAVGDLLVRGGVSMGHACVIQGGTQVDDFAPLAIRRWEQPEGGLRLLYAGRLTPEKGVHTAVKALALVAPRTDRPLTLDLVGGGDRRYVDELRMLVRRTGLAELITFRTSVPRSEMPGLLAQYDALLFPSEWEEPFARVVIEAMATGLVVIGTTTGGTGDALIDGETGLTFPPGDAVTLATQIQHLRDDRVLGQRLATAARRRVEERFTFGRMADQIETYLQTLVSKSGG